MAIAAGQTLDLDFALAAQAVNLAEMVVVGYGEQRQGNITGAVTNVTSEEFNTGRVVSPQELIQNKVAGRAGGREHRARRQDLDPDPRADVHQRQQRAALRHRRGRRSADGGGVSFGRDPLNFLNPDDIASITVLRDAGRRGDLRHQRGQRRGADHDQAGAAGPEAQVRVHRHGVHLGRSPGCRPCSTRSSSLRREQFAPAERRSAAEREHRLVRASSIGVASARSTTSPSRVPARAMDYRVSLNFLDQNGIIDDNEHPAHRPRRELQPAARQRPAEPAVQPQRLADRRRLHALGCALQHRADGPDPADRTIPAPPTGFYDWPGRAALGRQPGRHRRTWPRRRPTTYRASATCRPNTACPGSRGSGPTSTSASTSTDARAGELHARATLHREVVTGRRRHQSRYNPHQT